MIMNASLNVLVRLLAQQSVRAYQQDSKQFEFILILKHLKQESRMGLLKIARKISERKAK